MMGLDARTFQLISQMTKFGVEKPICRDAANAIGPSGQCGATPTSYVLQAIIMVSWKGRLGGINGQDDILGHIGDPSRFADTTCMCNIGLYNINTTQLKVWADVLSGKKTLAKLHKRGI
jgi:hypothetical protein